MFKKKKKNKDLYLSDLQPLTAAGKVALTISYLILFIWAAIILVPLAIMVISSFNGNQGQYISMTSEFVFSTKNFKYLFELISQVLRYVFIILIYLFIFSILRLMYLDVKSITSGGGSLDDAYLKVVNRLDSLNFKMQEYYVIDGDISLGRSSKNDVVIKDKFVSKNHLLIREKNQRYYLEDLGSANGTFLNGVKIDPNELIELQNNDKIGVGFIQFIFVDKRWKCVR